MLLLSWKHGWKVWLWTEFTGSDVKYKVLTENIRSSSRKYTVFFRKLNDLLTETIRSAKVYGPQKLKVDGLIEKNIRSCESIRSLSWLIMSHMMKNGKYTIRSRDERSVIRVKDKDWGLVLGSRRTIYFPHFTLSDSFIIVEDRILSGLNIFDSFRIIQLQDRIHTAFYIYDSLIMIQLQDRILFTFYIYESSNLSKLEDHILSTKDRILFEKDRILFCKGPYTFRQRQCSLRQGPSILRRDRILYFSGPYT